MVRMYARRRSIYRRRRVPYNKARTPKPNLFTQKYSISDIASSAWKGVKLLSNFINSETHCLHTTFSGNISNTSTLTHLSAVAQGDGTNQRTGNSILLRSFEIRLSSEINTSATVSKLRHIIFMDNRQVADTAPTEAEVIQSAGNPYSPRRLDNMNRFIILVDNFQVLSTNDNQAFKIEKHINLEGRNLHITFNGSSGTDINQKGLYMLSLSNEATNTPSMTGYAALYFHDN